MIPVEPHCKFFPIGIKTGFQKPYSKLFGNKNEIKEGKRTSEFGKKKI